LKKNSLIKKMEGSKKGAFFKLCTFFNLGILESIKQGWGFSKDSGTGVKLDISQ